MWQQKCVVFINLMIGDRGLSLRCSSLNQLKVFITRAFLIQHHKVSFYPLSAFANRLFSLFAVASDGHDLIANAFRIVRIFRDQIIILGTYLIDNVIY